MRSVLALDPSINSCGVTLSIGGTILFADRVRANTPTHLGMGVRCFGMAVQVRSWLNVSGIEPDTLVFEWPQIYHGPKSKGDPNDLTPMAGVGMCLVPMLPACADLRTPMPAEWIGQCPKVCPKCRGKSSKQCRVCQGSAWKTPRGRRIFEKCTPAERARIPDQHDAIDSAGLNLWVEGRLVLARVFPGAV